MEILKKTGKFLLGVVIGVAIMMFADRYYVKGVYGCVYLYAVHYY